MRRLLDAILDTLKFLLQRRPQLAFDLLLTISQIGHFLVLLGTRTLRLKLINQLVYQVLARIVVIQFLAVGLGLGIGFGRSFVLLGFNLRAQRWLLRLPFQFGA